jgi:ATP-dependent Lon protease
MELPAEAPVMILPRAILFPQAMLPLHIFEPRYRKMLADSLETHRMFSVAMQRPGCLRELPCHVAGIGIIRASVQHPDGTSHLVLQGLARVQLGEAVRYKPYRVQRIVPIEPKVKDSVMIDALIAKARELVDHRLRENCVTAFPYFKKLCATSGNDDIQKVIEETVEKFIEQVNAMDDGEQLVDTVCGALLQNPLQRQLILETCDTEMRLKHLIHFLLAESNRGK